MNQDKRHWKVLLRPYVSMTMFFSSIYLGISSIVVYVLPGKGILRRLGDPAILGLSRTDWINLHVVFGFLLVPLFAVHLYLNWRSILCYLRRKTKEFVQLRTEFILTLIITVALATAIILFPEWASALTLYGKEFFQNYLETLPY